MAIVNCSAEMSKYHKDRVTLNKADQDEMRGRRDAGRTRLRTGLERDGYPGPTDIVSQGSYAMRTMVQDPDCDYDIDDGAYFKKDDLTDSNGTALSPYAARQRVCNVLNQDGRMKHAAEVHNNCVRQEYPEGYHIDVPIYRVVTRIDAHGDAVSEYELSSKDQWVKSDARAVTKWFKEIVGDLNTGEEDGSQMRRMTRLTKKFARSRADWKRDAPSGICVTKLVVECFAASPGRDDEALRDTWRAISNRLARSLRIDHPVLTGTLLADEGDARVASFRDHLEAAILDLEVLEQVDCKKKKALGVWDEIFDTTFFSGQYDATSESKQAAAIAASLLQPAASASDLSFPNRPVVPNKPAGFA